MNIILLLIFFQILKNIKTILSSQAMQKLTASQIWPIGQSLQTTAIREYPAYGRYKVNFH